MLRKIAYVWMFLTFAMASPAQTQSVFLQPTSLDPSNGNGYLSGAAVADFNGDGKPDIAYRDGTVWLAKADGTYQTTTSWCSTGQPYCQQQAVFAADVNQDGKQDLVVATSNYVWVLLGKGDIIRPEDFPPHLAGCAALRQDAEHRRRATAPCAA